MEPLTTALAAFAAVQKTVQVIKQAQKTINDVTSLGPLVSQYFGAKQETIKAVEEAKKKGGSSLAQVVELELQLLSQEKFENELKMIFFTTGHADTWDKITKRVAEAEKEAKEAQRRARDAAIQKAKKTKQLIDTIIGVGLVVVLVPPILLVLINGIIFAKDQGWFK